MFEEEKKYYSVKCKCGHVGGKRFYIPIEFAVKALSKKEAAQIARWIPRCKHHQKDCILEVKELTFEEYLDLNKKNYNDPYLRCHSNQEQRCYDLSSRIIPESEKPKIYKKDVEKSIYMYGKRKIKKPKQYMRDIYRIQEAYCY